MMYEEIDKAKGIALILELSYEPANLIILSKNEVLIGALVRYLNRCIL